MSTILIRRGPKASLDLITLESGELGFTTDTREVWVGDGTANLLVGRAIVGLIANRPAAGVSGRIYEATDEQKTYLDNGSTWKLVGVASLDDVSDGSVYAKVLATELESGQVKQVRAVTNTTDITGDTLYTHLTDDAKHREINDTGTGEQELWSAFKIDNTKADKLVSGTVDNLMSFDASGNIQDSGLKRNDSGTSTQDLWSANKIQNQISNTTSGLTWQDAVMVLKLVSDASQGGSDPTGAAKGDAYIVNNWSSFSNDVIAEYDGSAFQQIGTLTAGQHFIITDSGAAGSFAGQEENIAIYDGTWNFSSPAEGWAVLVVGDGGVYENNGYTYSNGAWIQFTGAGQINAGVGLAKDGNTIDVLLGAGIAQLPTDEVGVHVVANDGLRLTSLTTDGQLTVDYDDSTIGIVSDKLAVKDAGITPTNLNASVAGDGLAGGAGTALSVGQGNGISVTADAIAVAVEANKGLAVDASGVKTVVDGSSIVHDLSGQLAVNLVDGGSF